MMPTLGLISNVQIFLTNIDCAYVEALGKRAVTSEFLKKYFPRRPGMVNLPPYALNGKCLPSQLTTVI